MKFSLASALVLSAVAPAVAYNVGPGRFVSSPRGRVFARRTGGRCAPNGCVDRAFEDLAAELNEDRFRQRQRRRGGGGGLPTMNNPWTQGVNEETLRQQQAWLNRAFGLAEDVAKSVASSPSEMKEADEAIRQSKEFADKMFGFVRGESPYKGDSKSSVSSQILRDDKEMFEVSLDVPGVKESDLDVTVEGTKDKTLVVSGKRSVGKDGNGVMQTKDFLKTFPLTYNADVDMMAASLENGVLVVTVPRISVEATETTRKIPLTSSTSSEVQTEDENKPFQLDLDVPGVKESNIDIEVKGDTDKTLTIKAVRELGKDSEGKPRTTELSKEFQINELVDTSKIVATLSDGVLTVSAPVDEKKAETSVKKVTVNGSPVTQSAAGASATEDVADDSDTSDATDEGEGEGNETKGM